jgi:malonate transporter and related proteins
MAIVIAGLLPVFLLIVLGFVLRRSLMWLETQWHGLERLTQLAGGLVPGRVIMRIT